MNQRGSTLIGVMLIASAAATIAALATLTAATAARELSDRRAVLCARYAARGGAMLGTIADGRPDLVAPSVAILSVIVKQRTPTSCLIISTASCAQAVRSVERRARAGSRCN